MSNPIPPEKKKKIDNSAEFHRAKRKEREEGLKAPKKVGEGKDNLKGRAGWFKNRTGKPKP